MAYVDPSGSVSTPQLLGQVRMNAQYGTVAIDTDDPTITFDLSISNIHMVTLGGNRTLVLANVKVGLVFRILLE